MTQTVTYTATVVQPYPTIFSGLTAYIYTNTYNFDLANPGFDATTWRNNTNYVATALYQSFDSIRLASGYCTVPGTSYYGDCTRITIVLQGFFYAPQNGTYIFTVPAADNFLGAWSGTTAYNNYSNSNSDFTAVRAGPVASLYHGGAAAYNLTAGSFLPFTFIYANGRGPGSVDISLTLPNGTSVTDPHNIFIPACTAGNPFLP